VIENLEIWESGNQARGFGRAFFFCSFFSRGLSQSDALNITLPRARPA